MTLVEPTTRSDGAPLTGLKECTYRVTAPSQVAGSVKIPASSPSGGGRHPILTNLEGVSGVDVEPDCVREIGGSEGARSAKATLSDVDFPVFAPGAPALER